MSEQQNLSLATLRQASRLRLPLYRNPNGKLVYSQPDGSDWNLSRWSNALFGEAGEAANIIKKIEREDFTLEEARQSLAHELADVLIYLDLLAFRAGINLAAATIEKFNIVSNDIGCALRIENDAVVARTATENELEQPALSAAHNGNAFCDLPGPEQPAYTAEQVARKMEEFAKILPERLRKIRAPNYMLQMSPDRQAAWRDGQRAVLEALRSADVSDIVPGVVKHFSQAYEEMKTADKTVDVKNDVPYASVDSTRPIMEITPTQLALKLGKSYLEVAAVFEQFRAGRIDDLPEAYKAVMLAMCDGKEEDFSVRVAMPTYSTADLTAVEIRVVNEMCHSNDFIPYPAVGTPAVFETSVGLVPCTTLGIDSEKPNRIWIRLSANKDPWKAGEVFHCSQTRVIPRACVGQKKHFARCKAYEYTQDKYVPTTDT